MAKILKIETCEGCPYHESYPIHEIEDGYGLTCHHPDLEEKPERVQKFKFEATPFTECPLPDDDENLT